MKGRKRQILVDSLGLLWRVAVQPANWQDRYGARQVLRRVPFHPRWRHLLVDSGYASPSLHAWCQQLFGVTMTVVRRSSSGFTVLPGRWRVERTFAWLGRWRRLSKDYEQLPVVSETFVYVAMIGLMLHRLSGNT